MDDFYAPAKTSRIDDLNVVPILDMFISLIFFLILATSFVSYSKLTIPPSGISKVTEPMAPPPLSPKILAKKVGTDLVVKLKWEGGTPGVTEEKWSEAELKDSKQVVVKAKTLLEKFTTKFPGEKTLQLSLSKDVNFQTLVSIMDGARDVLPDVVLNSSDEADQL